MKLEGVRIVWLLGTAWLEEEPAYARQLKAILAPYPSEEMTCSPVSPRGGNVKNNDPSLIEPTSVR